MNPHDFNSAVPPNVRADNAVTHSVQISNFKFVNVRQKAGYSTPSLRFTMVAAFGDPQLVVAFDGCLAKIKQDGELVWSPPLSRASFGAQLKTGWVNQEMYDRVIEALASSEYIAGLQKEGWDATTGVPASQGVINV